MEQYMAYIIGAVALVGVFYWISLYNRMVSLSKAVDHARACIQTQLQQRYDLLPDVVMACRACCSQEQALLDRILEQRRDLLSRQAPPNDPGHESLSRDVSRLFALGEQYPALRSVEAFVNAQTIEHEVEKDLAASRQWYNAAAADLGVAVHSFPTAALARVHGFTEPTLFSASAAAQAKPCLWGEPDR